MSDCAKKFKSSFVSYEAFEVACHALESYCDRLKDSEVEKLKVFTSPYLFHHFIFLIKLLLGSLLSSRTRDCIDQTETSIEESWAAKRQKRSSDDFRGLQSQRYFRFD